MSERSEEARANELTGLADPYTCSRVFSMRLRDTPMETIASTLGLDIEDLRAHVAREERFDAKQMWVAKKQEEAESAGCGRDAFELAKLLRDIQYAERHTDGVYAGIVTMEQGLMAAMDAYASGNKTDGDRLIDEAVERQDREVATRAAADPSDEKP